MQVQDLEGLEPGEPVCEIRRMDEEEEPSLGAQLGVFDFVLGRRAHVLRSPNNVDSISKGHDSPIKSVVALSLWVGGGGRLRGIRGAD